MSDIETLRESSLDTKSLDIVICNESIINNFKPQNIPRIKLTFFKRLFGSIEKFLMFTSLIVNGLGVALLSHKDSSKEVYSVGMCFYLVSWIFLFSRFIRMEN